MSTYTADGIDLDTIFEPWQTGDPKLSADDLYGENGKSRRDVYAPLTMGAVCPANIKYEAGGQDFRDLFAAKGSVPRFATLPWARTVAPPVASFYRQPSRALRTNISVACRVLEDGRCEITTSVPSADSNPANNATSVVYALTSPAVWDNSKVPAGVDYEIRFDVTSGSGVTLSSGLTLGTWIRLTSGHAGVIATGLLSYAHASQGVGSYSSDAQLKISLRRTDYPLTNKTEGVLVTQLKLSVLDSLFNPSTDWAKAVAAVNSLATNYHNPEANTVNYSNSIACDIKLDGTLVLRTKANENAWATTLSTRWRRADAPVATTDYDVKFTAVSNVGLQWAANPLPDWTQMTKDFTAVLTHLVPEGSNPNVYTANGVFRLQIRQRSTMGYVQSGVTLADNFVTGDIAISSSLTIQQPQSLPWPSLAAWDGVYASSETAKFNPEANNSVIEFVRATFKANGDVVVTDSNGQLATGRWLPPGVANNKIELLGTFAASGTGIMNEVNQLATWTTLTSGEKYIEVKCVRTPAGGVGTDWRRMLGDVKLRRKSYPSDMVSGALDIKATATMEAPIPFTWPDMSNWAKNYPFTDTVSLNPDAFVAPVAWGRATFYATGDVTITGPDSFSLTGRWLPAGVTSDKVEIICNMKVTSGSDATGSEVNQLNNATTNPVWSQVLTGSKYLQSSVTREQAKGLGTGFRRYNGPMSIRRKAYPSEIVTIDLSFWLEAIIGAPVPYQWPSLAPWDGTYEASNMVVYTPENPQTVNEWVQALFKANGDVVIEESGGVLATGRWLPPGVSNAQVEAYAPMSVLGNAASNEINQLGAWTTITTDKKIYVLASRPAALAVGESTRKIYGSVILRRKSYPSEQVSCSLSLEALAVLSHPDQWPWPDTSSWAITHTRIATEVLVPGSTAVLAAYMVARFHANGNVQILYNGAVIATGKWHPGGAGYDGQVEIVASVGGTGNGTQSVTNDITNWTVIPTSSFRDVRVDVSRAHSSDAGTSNRTAIVSVSARRKNYPSEIKGKNVTLDLSVVLSGIPAPNWSGMTVPALNSIVTVPQDPSTPNAVVYSGALWRFTNPAEGVQLNSTGQVISVIANALLIPAGFNAADFEYRFRDIVFNSPSNGANMWYNIGDPNAAAPSVVMQVAHSQGQGTYDRVKQIELDIRRKNYPAHSHTFVCNMLARVVLAEPEYTLWPRADYNQWAGTYVHTTTGQVIYTDNPPAPAPWAAQYIAYNKPGIDGAYSFKFLPDGTCRWETGDNGSFPPVTAQWYPQLPANGSNFSIRVVTDGATGIDGQRNPITKEWGKLNQGVPTTKSFLFMVPYGSIETMRHLVQIRDDTSLQIVVEGWIELVGDSRR